jgi:hypothetical protein
MISVMLSEAKHLIAIDAMRSFASLRMTGMPVRSRLK